MHYCGLARKLARELAPWQLTDSMVISRAARGQLLTTLRDQSVRHATKDRRTRMAVTQTAILVAEKEQERSLASSRETAYLGFNDYGNTFVCMLTIMAVREK